MAEAVVGTVLENLISFAGREFGLFLGFNQEKEKLESMFTAIKATLQDAEEKQFSKEGARIKDWLRKIKDVAYKLDDIMDECAYEVLRMEDQGVKFGLPDKVQCSCLSFFDPKHVAFRYKIAKKMKRISERLKEIYDERTEFRLTEMIPERRSEVIERPQTTSLISEPQVYGRKKDADQIINILIGDTDVPHSEDLSVYPIVGLGGLGKTTLAQLIFNDERVVNHFELRIWVCVSEDFSLKRMTKAIIEAITESTSEDLDLQPLQRKLQNLLQRKRYLLVLDDVWYEKQENWQLLKSSLTCGAKGASILVTTRLSTVASIMGTVPPYELSGLPENDCWELFKHRAFAPNEEEHAELVVIGKEIVKKCGGVPLAAKALGGLLRLKRKKIEWLNVKESNLLELPHDENSIMPVLRLSYLNLPIELRQCFAYCAIFPKDERIRKQDLIELWVANGFISSNERFDAEDVGDGVWNELYWRSFFQDVVEKDIFNEGITFKMHDLVHDLAQFVAEDVCSITNDNAPSGLSERIHHLSDHRWTWNSSEVIQLLRVKSLRTYIMTSNAAQLSTHVSKCYSLRVLRRNRIKKLPSSIGDLKHLRYLNLSDGEFETLPESLGKLWNLLILKLDSCKKLRSLPNSLVDLKALQQLSLNGCWKLSSLPPEIGKLSSLRNLSKYIVGEERGFLLSELGPLKLKGDLRIEHLEKVKSVADAEEANMSIKQLNELELKWERNEEWELQENVEEILELKWERNEEWELQENVEEILEVLQPDTQHLKSLKVEGYKGVHLPQWMSTSPSLESLTLWYLPNLESLPDCIGSLPLLEELYIGYCEKLRCLPTSLSLTSLKKLRLRNLPNLESLPDCIGSLPLLEELYIGYCEKLRCLPTSLSLTSLKKLRLRNLPNLESLPDCIGSLPLLEWLYIGYCEKLRCLPTSLSLLTSLKKLRLLHLPNLESLPDCIGSLPLLEWLYIWECEKLRCLPTSLSLLTSLKKLRLRNLPNLESLPDCIGSLPLLEKLYIWECEKLRCLPTSLSLLTSLKRLWIAECPELIKRCEKETGEDWPKIAHIPYIYIFITEYLDSDFVSD